MRQVRRRHLKLITEIRPDRRRILHGQHILYPSPVRIRTKPEAQGSEYSEVAQAAVVHVYSESEYVLLHESNEAEITG